MRTIIMKLTILLAVLAIAFSVRLSELSVVKTDVSGSLQRNSNKAREDEDEDEDKKKAAPKKNKKGN